MEHFRAGATQVDVRYQDLEYNLDLHLQLIRETAKAECRLIVFPELSVTGHNSSPDIVRFAEEADGRIFHAIQTQARESDIVVGYGFCELARGTHYNSYALVGPEGLLGIQRKVHASYDEFFRFRQAYEWNVFNLGFCRAGVTICHDTDFFESWRVLALLGAEVILLPHAIRKMINDEGELIFDGGESKETMDKLLAAQQILVNSSPNVELHRVQARSNGVYAIFSDQVGYDGHSTHVGGAYVLSPEGKMITRAESSVDNVWVSAELDPQSYLHVRRSPWFALKKRRPETYGELVKQL